MQITVKWINPPGAGKTMGSISDGNVKIWGSPEDLEHFKVGGTYDLDTKVSPNKRDPSKPFTVMVNPSQAKVVGGGTDPAPIGNGGDHSNGAAKGLWIKLAVEGQAAGHSLSSLWAWYQNAEEYWVQRPTIEEAF